MSRRNMLLVGVLIALIATAVAQVSFDWKWNNQPQTVAAGDNVNCDAEQEDLVDAQIALTEVDTTAESSGSALRSQTAGSEEKLEAFREALKSGPSSGTDAALRAAERALADCAAQASEACEYASNLHGQLSDERDDLEIVLFGDPEDEDDLGLVGRAEAGEQLTAEEIAKATTGLSRHGQLNDLIAEQQNIVNICSSNGLLQSEAADEDGTGNADADSDWGRECGAANPEGGRVLVGQPP